MVRPGRPESISWKYEDTDAFLSYQQLEPDLNVSYLNRHFAASSLTIATTTKPKCQPANDFHVAKLFEKPQHRSCSPKPAT